MAAFLFLLTHPQRLGLLQTFVANEKVDAPDFIVHYEKEEGQSKTKIPKTKEYKLVDDCLDSMAIAQKTMKARRSLVNTMKFLQRHNAYEHFTRTPPAMAAGGYAAQVLMQ